MGESGFISPRVFQQRLERVGLTVTIDTIWRWCQQRRIDARKFARQWKIRESEVQRVVEAGTDGDSAI